MLLLSGCANYSQSFHQIESLLAQQQPDLALLELEKHPQSGKDKLLYLLDKAMLQHMSGLYVESNSSFEQAKQLMEHLSATSIAEQVGSIAINDGVRSYAGEDYEQLSTHLFGALNYIKLGLWDEARVEALQADARLKSMQENSQDSLIEDAFLRYLTGIIYEQDAEWADAMIAYRKAYEAYQAYDFDVPVFLQQDLLRLSQKLDLKDEYQTYQDLFGMGELLPPMPNHEQQGEVILVLHHSLAPIKRAQETWVFAGDGVQHRISLPYYQSRPSYMAEARLMVGQTVVYTAKVDDFDGLARASFANHKASMVARLIARAVVKATLAHQAERHGGELFGLIADVAGMVTETADTRSWLTLPKNIHFARLALDAGVYPVTLELLDEYGDTVMRQHLKDIEVSSGKISLIEHFFTAPYRLGN